MKQKDLAEVVGFKSRVSEILSKKRKLTLGMIRKLNSTLHIPTEVLVQDYLIKSHLSIMIISNCLFSLTLEIPAEFTI